MSEGWLQVPLGELCSMVRGTYPILKTEPGEYPLVVTAAYRRSASTFQMEGPAVCIPLVSSTGHGDAALHRVHYQDGKFALANLLVALLPRDPHQCDAKYLYYLLNTKKDEYFVPLMLGTANVSLKEKDIAGVQVSLPPLSEQRRIVGRIEELAGKIEEARGLRRQAVEEAEALVHSTFHSTFEMLAAFHGKAQVGTFADVKGGKRLPAGERLSDIATPFVYIRVADMKGHSVDIADLKYVPTHLHEGIKRYTISSKDVYVTIAGTIGYPGTIPNQLDGANLTENAAKLVFHHPNLISRSYIALALRSPQVQDQFAEKQTTAAQPKLALHRISSTKMPVPPLAEQERIVAYLDGLQAKVDALKALQGETENELTALLPSVLDRAFSGRL